MAGTEQLVIHPSLIKGRKIKALEAAMFDRELMMDAGK